MAREHRRNQVAHNTTKPKRDSELQIGGVANMIFGDLVF